ncbi:MAG: hypothetical protein Q8911_14015 [Bacillota bacterium]|nr:hypothetical protein [Bacillota bacterium]
MTLDQMIDQILENTGNDSSSKVEYTPRFKASLNYAKNKMAKERYSPDYSETVTLTDETYNLASLTKNILKIIKITDSNNTPLNWERTSITQIKVPGQANVTIQYSYLPADLINTTDVLDFPLSVVDPQILCYFATYQYFLIEGGNNDLATSSYWLNLWNDGFNNISKNIGEVERIKEVYWS